MHKKLKWILVMTLGVLNSLVLSLSASASPHFPAGANQVEIPDQPGVRKELLANIAPLVQHSIAEGYYPGAVILAAHKGNIIYKGVFGSSRVEPNQAPMQFETIFDIASLTKVIVTTTAIMQLMEAGKLDLDARVAEYWPAFAQSGKGAVTIRELLTHTSGFAPDLDPWKPPTDAAARYKTGLTQVETATLVAAPGKVFTYSDINFITLGHLVEIISGQPLADYAKQHIFQPLNLSTMTFNPPSSLREQIAPTSSPEDQQMRWGTVNDPTTERMGGVSGVAGLFSNAHDLGIFLQCLLNGGRIDAQYYLLGPLTVLKMSTPQTPLGMLETRGLGWDIDSVFASRGVLLSNRSYGHTGWTGVSVWLDPATQTWVMILTSRSHPTLPQKNQLIRDRRAIADIIAGSLTDVAVTGISNTSEGELHSAYTKFAKPTQ
ncbi:MAG: serine hydrolase domain-containing protein [Gammaproteobacteria bacterium]